jgi:hypothetical protein
MITEGKLTNKFQDTDTHETSEERHFQEPMLGKQKKLLQNGLHVVCVAFMEKIFSFVNRFMLTCGIVDLLLQGREAA